MSEAKREPLFHISKRTDISWQKALLIRVIAIALALGASAIICLLLTDDDPLAIYSTIIKGTFGTPRKTWVTFRDVAMLLCISLAVTPAFKMRFWNIGGEGQTLMGCLASASCMILLRDVLPNWALILVMLLTSMLAGAIWGGIPALFKAKWNTNETLFTLMMNYIAIQLTSFAVSKWENPPGSNSIGTINSKGDVKYVGWIGNMFSDGYNKDFMWTVIIVLILAALVYLYLKYTKHGYEIAVVGESQRTASYAGIKVERVIIRTMVLSGAVCGLMWDYTAGRTVGMLALELMILCFGVSVVVQLYLKDTPSNFVLLAVVCALLVLSADWLFFYYMPGYAGAGERFLWVVLPSALMTAPGSWLLHCAVRRISTEFKIDNGVV